MNYFMSKIIPTVTAADTTKGILAVTGFDSSAAQEDDIVYG